LCGSPAGLEDIEDLIADLKQALKTCESPCESSNLTASAEARVSMEKIRLVPHSTLVSVLPTERIVFDFRRSFRRVCL
jgi:hypothetical protein